jgi:Xaa-Pro dipeptidase
MLKAGALWDDIHLTAHEIAIEGLLKLGILKGDKEEILKARTSVAFFPHGLGHYLGMDTHDTGGHANYQDKDTMFRYLRVRGNVPAGSVITVEPGVSLSSTYILSIRSPASVSWLGY